MRIFLDSGDPDETRKTLSVMTLDGQTTNPSLIAKNPEIAEKILSGEKLTETDLLKRYQKIVQEISNLIPNGSISIEVYADENSTAQELLEQAKIMNTWIPNAQIKLPIIKSGVEAAILCLTNNIKVNMTLCFSEEQAAIIDLATKGCKKGDVFISPFIGRLEDKGLAGVDLISNIKARYLSSDSQVEILAASIRTVTHLHAVKQANADIATVPFAVLTHPDTTEAKTTAVLTPIVPTQIDPGKDWRSLNIYHTQTKEGLDKFIADWKKIFE
ncbi:MAG: transaldolase family protein [bacterium]